MATFTEISKPTPFGIYDADSDFQTEAECMQQLPHTCLSLKMLKIQFSDLAPSRIP